MHNAPPVVYPLGRSRFQGWLLLGCWIAGLVVAALWWRAVPAADWRLGLALAAVLVAGAAAVLGWKNAAIGQLRWDGQVWCWESCGDRSGTSSGTSVGALSVALDLQHALLLRCENQDRATVWLWASRSALPERWLDLRRAVYSRRRALPAAPLADDVQIPVAAADFFTESHPPRPYS